MENPTFQTKRFTLDPADALIQNRHAGQVYDPSIMAYRPQRMSIASTKSTISWSPPDHAPELRPETRRSSVSSYASLGSQTSIYSQAHTTATSMESRRSSFSAQLKARSTQPLAPVFKRLPPSVYECILQQLRILHIEAYVQSCATCHQRDLHSLALTSRAWDRAVRPRLYDQIHLNGHDSPQQIKKHKLKTGVRIKLLRRTLRERRILAQCVHELKVPNVQNESSGELESETIDLVASLVMACPNLERLIGFYPTYHHEFNRLTYALSTRRNLKEFAWVIGENDVISQRSQTQLPPGLMDVAQVDSFIHYHTAWTSLTTLLLSSENSGILEHDVFMEVFTLLPALQHLHVSKFDCDDFNDATLLALPALKSLRLDSLEGITDAGLSRFASNPTSHSLQRLSLLYLPLTSLLIVSKILAHMPLLTRFMLIQPNSPTVPSDSIIFPPLLASNSLTYLHWEIFAPHNPATEHLAASIRANGFPALRTIRGPSDHTGLLQALCRPRAQIVLPSDKYNRDGAERITTPGAMTPGLKTPQSGRSSYFPSAATSRRTSVDLTKPQTLFQARKAAQARIDEARKTVQFKVVVDEGGIVSQIYDFQGFVGTIGSKISYALQGDYHTGGHGVGSGVGGHAGQGLAERAEVSVADLQRGESEREGCTGLWNASCPAGRKWWWHRERPRWRGPKEGLEALC